MTMLDLGNWTPNVRSRSHYACLNIIVIATSYQFDVHFIMMLITCPFTLLLCQFMFMFMPRHVETITLVIFPFIIIARLLYSLDAAKIRTNTLERKRGKRDYNWHDLCNV